MGTEVTAAKTNKEKKSYGYRLLEARPKGRSEGSHIDDYVIETQGDHVLGTFTTQKAAIDWTKANGHSPHVARVRHLNDKKRTDHWRAV